MKSLYLKKVSPAWLDMVRFFFVVVIDSCFFFKETCISSKNYFYLD